MIWRKVTFAVVGFGFLLWPYSQTLGLAADSQAILLTLIYLPAFTGDIAIPRTRAVLFALIYLPAFTLALYSSVRRLKPWPDQLQAVGIPLGISCSIFVLVATFQNINSSAELFEAIGNAFLAIFHGGVIAAFGYFFASKEDFQSATHSRADIVILVSLCSAPVFLASWLLGISFLSYVYLEAALLVLAPYVFLASAKGLEPFQGLWSGKATRAFPSDELLKATVIGMLGPVLLSMTVWLLETEEGLGDGYEPLTVVVLGLLGILYGAILLTTIICLSKPSKELRKASWRASWHALEIYALLILVLYAPPSILELMSSP